MDIDYSSLSDQDLSQMLKDYGVSVGPINMATRKTYERKLQKLKTGQAVPATKKYEPVANDEDDQEIQFKPQPVTPQATKAPKPSPASVPLPKTPRTYTPEPTQPRQRRDPADIYSPVIESRPDLMTSRKTTLSYEPRKVERSPAKASTKEESSDASKSLPVWVKLVVLFIVLILVYLIYNNMEANVGTNVPKIPGKMEV